MEFWKEALRSLLVRLRIIPKPDLVARVVRERPAPESMEPGVIYVTGDKSFRKWAWFRCPADAGEIIQLSLMQKRRPRWQVSIDWLGRPTLDPSVRQLDGSFAHFLVKQGRVVWCLDSGIPM